VHQITEQFKVVTIVQLLSQSFSQVVRFKLLLRDISFRTGIGNLSLVAGQKQTQQGMAGRTDLPPLILFILLFMMLKKHGKF